MHVNEAKNANIPCVPHSAISFSQIIATAEFIINNKNSFIPAAESTQVSKMWINLIGPVVL